eukprot:1778438-Pyramimonas_sp.AAC.1
MFVVAVLLTATVGDEPPLVKRGLVKTTSGPNLTGASLENDGRGALSRTENGQFTNRRVRVG